MHYLLQIGRQPRLSVAEIAAVLPAVRVSAVGHKQFARLSGAAVTPQDFYQLGGALRLADIFADELTAPAELTAAIADELRARQPEGKIKFAIASFAPRPFDNKSLLMGVKQLLRESERSCRFVNRQWRNLDAGTLHAESCIASANGEKPQRSWEIIVVPARDGTLTLGLTVAAQDVNDWARRDVGKPVRDMQVGMLPAKLARMLVNLARDAKGKLPAAVWDCCCGTGTVPLEVLACGDGTGIFASDIAPQMVAATEENLAYFTNNSPPDKGGLGGSSEVKNSADDAGNEFLSIAPTQSPQPPLFVWQHDATTALTRAMPTGTVIVTEGYLGQICQRPLDGSELRERRAEVLPVYTGIFQQAAALGLEQIVICQPTWQLRDGTTATLDAPLGEWRRALPPLFYRREGQVVGREILVLRR